MKLYLGNLSASTTASHLGALVKPYGTAGPAIVVTDKVSGQSRGFAFIEFQSDEEARAAIVALNGNEVDGNVLTVAEAKPKRSFGSAQ